MKDPQTPNPGIDIALVLGVVAAICLACIVGFMVQQSDRRIKELSYQVELVEKEVAEHEGRMKQFEAGLAELALRPDVSERISMLEAWIEIADPQLAAMFQQLLQRDEILRSWIMDLGARVEALEKKPVAEKPLPTVKKPDKPKSKVKKAKAHYVNKRCNKPVTRCVGANPMVCEVR